MRFEFMGAFLDREGDDEYSIFERTLRLTCHSIIAGAGMLMVQSVWFSGYRGRPIDGALVAAGFFFIGMCLVLASYRVDQLLSTPLRGIYALSAFLLLILAAGEAGTRLGWWDISGVLQWWHAALLVVAVALAVLCAGEKAVQSRRSRRDNLESPG